MNSEYLSMFINETKEHLQVWSDGMLNMEKTREVSGIPLLFRAAHTIKGMALTMGFQHMGGITHQAENLLDGIRNDKIQLNEKVVEALFHSLDALEILSSEIEVFGEEQTTDWNNLIAEIERVTSDHDVSEATGTVHLDTDDRSETEVIVRDIANRAMEQGYRVYEFEIGFEDGCIMPMARWAQIHQQLDGNSLLYTDPEPSVLESSEYIGNIRFVVCSTSDIERLANEIHNIPEVRILNLGEWIQKKGTTVYSQGEVLPKGRLKIDEYVETIVTKAIHQGFLVYEVGIRLTTTSQLKGPRLFMVFEAVGGQNHLLYTNPAIDVIEREEFNRDVHFIMWSTDKIERIRGSIESISEIELVELREWKEQEDTVVRGNNKVLENSTNNKLNGKSTSKDSKKVGTIRVDTDKLDELMNLFSELVIDKTRLEQIRTEVQHAGLTQTTEHMSRVSNQLQELIMSIRMIPVESVFQRFPRMVRDTAKQLRKEIEFTVNGEDTELDRTVVEEIGDPIMHMLRNSIDHGIESTELRAMSGKSSIGHIDLRAYPSGNYVFIEVEDDGEGINRDKVLSKAIEKGIVKPSDNLTDQQVYQLLFATGFSTVDSISDLSGRGVGLDVVKAKIESLSGKIEIQSQPGKGTKFIIRLPLSLAILNGMIVRINGNPYVIPIGTIAEVSEMPSVQTVNGQVVTVRRDQVIPLIQVGEVFEGTKNKKGNVIFVHKGQQMVGLIVDELIGQQEVVLKSLDQDLSSISYFSGATILGDGTVALILDTNAFFKEEREIA